MDFSDVLRTVRQVAALPTGPVCACCGVALPAAGPATPPDWRCPRCAAHGCRPFQGLMKCLGTTDDDLGDLPRVGVEDC